MGSCEWLCLSFRVCICACIEHMSTVCCTRTRGLVSIASRSCSSLVSPRFEGARLAGLSSAQPNVLSQSSMRPLMHQGYSREASRVRRPSSCERITSTVPPLGEPYAPAHIILVSVLCPRGRSDGADRFHIHLVCSRLASSNAVLSKVKGLRSRRKRSIVLGH